MISKALRVVLVAILLPLSQFVVASQALDLWFAPGWQAKRAQAKVIADTLAEKSGLSIQPRIAASYPQILDAFSSDDQALVYVGSFVQAIIRARGLGEGLVQASNGKEFYSGVLVYRKGGNPESILAEHPAEIAYAVGASSGESSAKAATGGKASIATRNHQATSGAVKSGKAHAGVVKNWWWEGNGSKFPELDSYLMPGISETRNPDNVLAASKTVPADVRSKVVAAAKASKEVFGATEMVDFDPSSLDFSLGLMAKGNIDPNTYSW